MKELHARVAGEVRKVVVGQAEALEDMLAALALGGHVLLEGVPGTAKTLLASATARALGIDFRRLQFTPDMLPSDVTGTMALRAGELVFRPGPVFAGVVLADEINRTPPEDAGRAAGGDAGGAGDRSTASATRCPTRSSSSRPRTRSSTRAPTRCPRPSATASSSTSRSATRAPTRSARCCASRRRGLAPGRAGRRRGRSPAPRTCARRGREVDATEVTDEVVGYVVAIVRRTRELPSVALGASPRAAVHLLGAAKAAARLAGRAYVTPDDVSRMAAPVLRHRLVLTPEAELERATPAARSEPRSRTSRCRDDALTPARARSSSSRSSRWRRCSLPARARRARGAGARRRGRRRRPSGQA